jgi:hypothetical protein
MPIYEEKTLYSRDISLFDCHIEVYLLGPPQTNWTRIVSERGLVKISVIETDTATSGPVSIDLEKKSALKIKCPLHSRDISLFDFHI